MKANANLLADSVKEDFPQRTYQASQRIVREFGKTLERSTSLMKKWGQLWDDDNDDDNDNGRPPLSDGAGKSKSKIALVIQNRFAH